MRLKTTLTSDVGTHSIDLDLSSVAMTPEQEAIVNKLLAKVNDGELNVDQADPCVHGQCVASQHLTPDEFSKVRDLKATLGSSTVTAGLFADFCLHVVKVPN